MTLSACRNFYFAIGLALMWGSTMAELNKGRQLFEAGDYKEALAELTAADTVALPEAQNLIGRIYYFGNKDVPINHSHAVAWYRKAAEQGDANAQYNLGVFYEKGLGVTKDLTQAVAWYRKAAEQGNALAQNNLGTMHRDGSGGLLQDHEAAAKWYALAARQGNAWAQRNLYSMHRDAQVPQADLVQALAWINLAASQAQPHPDAAQERQELSAKLSPAQVAEAQRLAREWKVGDLLGKSRLRPVSSSLAASAEPATAPTPSPNDPYPQRPQAQAGVITCRTNCNNGDCYRTYADGRKKRFQAQQKWNSLSNRFEFDAGTC